MGSEFVLVCSGSLQGKGERCAERRTPTEQNPASPSLNSSGPKHFPPTHLQGGSSAEEISRGCLD